MTDDDPALMEQALLLIGKLRIERDIALYERDEAVARAEAAEAEVARLRANAGRALE